MCVFLCKHLHISVRVSTHSMIRFELIESKKTLSHVWIQAALPHELGILMLQHHDVQGPGRPFELHDASAEL